MRRVILASAISLWVLLVTSCGGLNIRTWYGNPEPSEYSVRLVGWPRSAITLEITDERPRPPSLAVQAPNSPITGWEDHSEAVVNEIRRILASALDETGRTGKEWILKVKVVEYVVSFDAPNWVGSTVVNAVLSDVPKTTTRHWTGTGRVVRWNWSGYATAKSALQDSFKASMEDLLRQLASYRITASDLGGSTDRSLASSLHIVSE